MNRTEIGFLLQYAINSLVASGVMFELNREPTTEEEVRIKYPKDKLQ